MAAASSRRPGPAHLADERGLVLAEVIMASFIFLIVSTGLVGLLVSSTSLGRVAKERTIAEQGVANEIELIRGMSYDCAATVGGNPSQPASCNPQLPASQAFTGVNGQALGVTATMTVAITYRNSNVPGTYVSGADFKKVVVTITRNTDGKVLASATTNLAPDVRPSQNTANLLASVVDYGTNAAMPNVPVSLSTGPSAPRADTTDGAGDVTFAGLAPNPTSGSQAYYDLGLTLPTGYVLDAADSSNMHVQLNPADQVQSQIIIYQPGTLVVSLTNASGGSYTGTASVTVTSAAPGRGSHTFSYTGSPLTITTLNPPSGELLLDGTQYTVDVTSSGNIVTPASQTVNMPTGASPTVTASAVVSAIPTKLKFTSGAVSGSASSSATLGPITVQAQDASGNPVIAGPSGIFVALTSSSGNGTFALTSGGSAVSAVTIPGGSSSTTFYYGDTTAGMPTITGHNGQIATDATQTETINAGAANKLVFTSAAASGVSSASATIGPITAQRQDSFGNPATTGGAITVNLSSNTTGTAKFSLTSGGSAVTSVTIASGASSASFFYGDTKGGTPTVTAASAGLTSATQQETVTASKLVITTSAVSGGASSSATLGPITVQRQDSLGNATTVGGALTVTLSSNSTGTARFAASSGGASVTTVTIPSGSSSVNFYYGDTKSATPVVTAASAGLTSATQTETITGGSATQLQITSSAISGTATNSATLGPLTIQRQDAFGNPTTSGSTTVNLSSDSSGDKFATSSGGSGVTTATIAAGSSTVTVYYGDTVAGAPTITVSATGLSGDTQGATINAGAATKLVFTNPARTGAHSASAPPTTSIGSFTVQRQDAYGNATTLGGAVTLTMSSSTTGGKRFNTASGQTTNSTIAIASGTSSVTFWYGDTVAGTKTLTAAATGLTSGTQSVTVT